MAVQGQCYYKRTDNHVKRVSCRLNTTLHLSVISVLCVVFIEANLVNAGDISCQGIRYTYFQKGFDTSDIPAAPQQGE